MTPIPHNQHYEKRKDILQIISFIEVTPNIEISCTEDRNPYIG